MANKPVHILRYGTVAEKVHLEKAISAYDYLSINGNSAAYVASAIAKFIVEKFFNKPEKGFFIDPITYAFQNEIKLLKSKSKATGEEKIKKSVEKLIENYGYPANKVKSNQPITVDDFNTEDAKYDFCVRILNFQYNLVYNHIEKNDLEKYFEYAVPGKKTSIPQFRPKFLIAPYFYLDKADASFVKWLAINTEFVCLARDISNSECDGAKVFAQIVLSKETLTDRESVNAIISAYHNVDCDGLTVWVDDLNEHEASLEELIGLVHLLKGLSHKPVYNMYGGYFSILLTHRDIHLLAGVSHGLEYGESRKVYPVGGGIPVSKYYYLPIHQRLDFTKAYYLLAHTGAINVSLSNWGPSDKYYANICRCDKCKQVIQDQMINFVEFESREFYEVHRKDQTLRRKKASSDTKENCLYHYLLCKKIEFLRASKQSLGNLLDDLNAQKHNYMYCEEIQENELDYIDIWIRVLKEVQSDAQ